MSMDEIKSKPEEFNYVDITTKDCDGWLNLFIGDHVLTLVNNKYIANLIRAVAVKRKINFRSK